MATKKRSARSSAPAAIRTSDVLSGFRRFADSRELSLDELMPLEALELMVAFFGEVRVEKRSIADKTDALLFQAGSGGPPERRHTSVNVTRQLYGGAGRSQPLGVDFQFDSKH